MTFLRCVLGGLIGGVIGILIWVFVGYFAHRQVGYIAWAVGFLFGVPVRYGAYLGDQDEGFGQGILAGFLSLGSIVTAKYILMILVVGAAHREVRRLVAEQLPQDDEAIISSFADEIAQKMIERGRPVRWPPGKTLEEAAREADYPAPIWKQAKAQWDGLSAQE